MPRAKDHELWGKKLTIITAADRNFLPGAYALFNSARDTGFSGGFVIAPIGQFGPDVRVDADGLVYLKPRPFVEDYHPFVLRFEALTDLPAGNYCLLDADVLIERPAGLIFDAIKDGLLVSTESEQRFDPNDVWVREQCQLLGLAGNLPNYPYINIGILGFQIPRDAPLIAALVAGCRKLFKGAMQMLEHPVFPLLEQDVFNVLVRQRVADGGNVFSISPRRIEFSRGDGLFWDRRFPWTEQGILRPQDQKKYLIHGASLRRPWLEPRSEGWRGQVARRGLQTFRRRLLGKLTPYERAWAWYACSAGQAIPVEAWAEQHDFRLHRNPLWRWANALPFRE